MSSLVILILTLVPLLFTSAGKPQASELHSLYLADQSDRGVGGRALPWGEVERNDRERRARVRDLIASGSLRSAEDFHDAAFIFQHSAAADDYPPAQAANDYLLAHVLASIAMQMGDARSRWISAATLDRYLRAIQQPQVFGTQYESKGNGPYTQEPYNRTLIPDSLRAVFCVPSLDQQKMNLAEFNSGKYPAGILPSGCTR